MTAEMTETDRCRCGHERHEHGTVFQAPEHRTGACLSRCGCLVFAVTPPVSPDPLAPAALVAWCRAEHDKALAKAAEAYHGPFHVEDYAPLALTAARYERLAAVCEEREKAEADRDAFFRAFTARPCAICGGQRNRQVDGELQDVCFYCSTPNGMPSPAMVERAARAMWESKHEGDDITWERDHEWTVPEGTHYRTLARCALTAALSVTP